MFIHNTLSIIILYNLNVKKCIYLEININLDY